METIINIKDTRQPSLTRAVIRQLSGSDSLKDICLHGVSGGFGGFIYYSDTVKFFKKHKGDIIARLEEDAKEYGMDMLAMVAGLNCLKDAKLGQWETAEAINGRGEVAEMVQNALAWYAAEEIAREMNPDL